jgi:polyhydroxybutyrate depolymerase
LAGERTAAAPGIAVNSVLCRAAALFLLVAAPGVTRAADAPARREWTVDGAVRETLVYVPPHATTQPTPVIFAFHGHGGTMRAVARNWSYHTLWPDALVVYPQGLPTPGRLTDPAGTRAGWQAAAGEEGDRDLKFFDAVLAKLRHDYRVDDQRIYATGHSNGGGFTYLLWAERGEQFAAFAPAAAVGARALPKLKPKPVFHVAGEKDPLVKFAWQEQMIAALRRLNQCGPAQPAENGCVTYPSKIGAPVVTFIHPGGHEVPTAVPPLIIAFFQQHAKP